MCSALRHFIVIYKLSYFYLVITVFNKMHFFVAFSSANKGQYGSCQNTSSAEWISSTK